MSKLKEILPLVSITMPFIVSTAYSACVPVSNPFTFSGRSWTVRSGSGGPGPNNWMPGNVCLDELGRLHLKITNKNGTWYSAQVQTVDKLGFGVYQFKIIGRPDIFDQNVTLGMYNYGTEDCKQEIDIELGRLGTADIGHYTVYPNVFQANCSNACGSSKGVCSDCGTEQFFCAKGFNYSLEGTYTTHRFTWSGTSVKFQSLNGHYDDDTNQFQSWLYQAGSSESSIIPQTPLKLNINYWLLGGKPPQNGKVPPEIIIKDFTYTPSL